MKWPWNCISWNALKEKFHSVSFPLDKIIFKGIYYSERLAENVFDMGDNCFYIVFQKIIYIRHLVYKRSTSTKC